jgi:hypothetical protein
MEVRKKVLPVKSSSGRFVQKPQIERRPTNVTRRDLTPKERDLYDLRMTLPRVATQSEIEKIITEMRDKGFLKASGSEAALTGLLETLTLNPDFNVNDLPDISKLSIGGGRKQRGGGDCKWYHKGMLMAMLACLWMFGGAEAAAWAYSEAATWSSAVVSSFGTTVQGFAQSIGNAPSTIFELLKSCGSYLYTLIPNMPAMPGAFNSTGVQTAWGNAFDIFLVKSSEMLIIMGQAVELELRLGGFGGGRIWKITMDWAAQNWIGIGATAIAGVAKTKYDALLKENQKLLEDLKAAKAAPPPEAEAEAPPEPKKGTLNKIMDAAKIAATGATSGANAVYVFTGNTIIFAQEVGASAMQKFCDSIDWLSASAAAAAAAAASGPAPEAPEAPDLQQEKGGIAMLLEIAEVLPPLSKDDTAIAVELGGGKRSTRKRNGRTRKPKTRNAKKRKSSGRKAKKVSRKMKSRKGRKTRRRGSKKR